MADRDGDSSYWAYAMRSGSQEAQADADAYQGHLARIAQYVRMWQDGQLTVEEKRQAIGAENEQFYGPDCPSRLRWHARK